MEAALEKLRILILSVPSCQLRTTLINQIVLVEKMYDEEQSTRLYQEHADHLRD